MKEMFILNCMEAETINDALDRIFDAITDDDVPESIIHEVHGYLNRIHDVLSDTEYEEKPKKTTASSTIERLDKLEKAVSDIPKTMGKITEKMMEANMGDKDKDLKSFSVNMYWNYDDSEDEEDDD